MSDLSEEERQRVLDGAGLAISSRRTQREELLAASASLIDRWHEVRREQAAHAASLISRARPHVSALLDRRETLLEDSKLLIDAYCARGIHGFDPFRIAGFSPDENALSDVLAALLDPRGPHGLGFKPLDVMLESVARQDPTRITALRAVLSDTSDMRVERELVESDTRPDIAVLSSRFIIFIENKVAGGRETGGDQTRRQWVALKARAESMGVPEDIVLGILLTPEGHEASSPAFVSLTTYALAGALIRELRGLPDSPIRTSLLAFLRFYAWFDI